MPSDVASSIAVFARAPVPGQAKTRLVPLLGAEGAARLQHSLTRAALEKAREVRGARVTLWVAGDPQHAAVRECARDFDVTVREQRGADLGARMAHAFADTLAGTPSDSPGHGTARCVLIGTDCPALTAADLQAALDALDDVDAVVQPAEDGGYVLIALKRPHARLFEGIAWSTSGVMAATRERLGELALRWHEPPMRPDLDTAADYAQALAAGWITA